MKKVIAIIAVLTMTLTVQAQQVFQEIYDSSFKTATDTSEDVGIRKIAAFKIDALTYLNTKMFEILTDETHKVSDKESAMMVSRLDSLAYYMYDYVNYFLQQYQRAEKPKHKEYVIKVFQEISLNNPLYRDLNRDVVFVYVDRKDYLTRFSLDTDWIKANNIVRKIMKDIP